MIYKYEGPVYHFEHIVIEKWTAYTTASSKEQALNNLKFKAKRALKMSPATKITLDSSHLKVGNTFSGF